MSDVEPLASFLRGHDEPCPICSYNLCNLEAQQCPECGARLSLTLKGAHALDVVWLAVIGFFTMIGTMMLLIGISILQGLVRGDDLAARTGPGVSFVVLTFMGPVFAIAIIFARRWLLRDIKGRVVLIAIPMAYFVGLCVLLYLL